MTTIFNAFTILDLLGWIGDAAFVIGGVVAAKKLRLSPFVQLLSGLSTAFFGGIFMRDLGLLRCAPAIFGSPIEIAATAVVGIITIAAMKSRNGKKKLHKAFSAVLCFADSIGIVVFAAFGYGRGITAGAPWWIALACAFVTACGGGVIAAVIRSAGAKSFKPFIKTVKGNLLYYLLCAFASVVCGLWHSPSGYPDCVIITLTLIVIVFGFIVERVKSARG
jgi:uncharacterized membrane protein YeiH